MATVQVDLFGWHNYTVEESRKEHRMVPSATLEPAVSVDELASALIEHFAGFIGTHQNLLEDDNTVCESLITVFKRFTRRQLRLVYKTDAWYAAWRLFNEYYLTNRCRGNACFRDGWTFTATMPELLDFKRQALRQVVHLDDDCEPVYEVNRKLCIYECKGTLYLVVTPSELDSVKVSYKPYWHDIAVAPITIDGVQLMIFGVHKDKVDLALNGAMDIDRKMSALRFS